MSSLCSPPHKYPRYSGCDAPPRRGGESDIPSTPGLGTFFLASHEKVAARVETRHRVLQGDGAGTSPSCGVPRGMGHRTIQRVAVAEVVPAYRPPFSVRLETPLSGAGAEGGFANRPSSPSAAVGWVKIASRSAVYGMPPSIAVWTTAINSLASAPKAVKPRMRSSAPISAFMNPRVCDSVRVRSTMRHGHPGDAVGHAPGPGFGLGQADVGQFRVGEQAVGNEPAARGPAAAGEVVQDDATIVLADVRELRAAGAFARRPDVRGAGLKSVVDADVASRIQLDARPVPRPAGRCWASGRSPPGCRRLRAFSPSSPERTWSVTPVPERPVTLSTSACNKTSTPSSVISSRSAVRHVGIFPLEQARAALDDRDAAAEPPHRLGEFQADVAAAEDDEVLGQPFEVQGFDVRHRPGVGKPGHIRNAGAGADVDEDALAPQRPRAAGVQASPARSSVP